MDAVLSELAYSSEVLEKFKQEKVIAGCWLRFSDFCISHNFHQINLRCSISCFHKSYLLTQQLEIELFLGGIAASLYKVTGALGVFIAIAIA